MLSDFDIQHNRDGESLIRGSSSDPLAHFSEPLEVWKTLRPTNVRTFFLLFIRFRAENWTSGNVMNLFFALHPISSGKLTIIVNCPGPRGPLIRPWFKPLVDIITSVTHVFSGYDLKFDPPLKNFRHPCSITKCLFWQIICFIILSLCGGLGFNFGTGPWLGSQRLCNNQISII